MIKAIEFLMIFCTLAYKYKIFFIAIMAYLVAEEIAEN